MTWIIQQTPIELYHELVWFIPDMLWTAYSFLSNPIMIITLFIMIIVWFFINLSR